MLRIKFAHVRAPTCLLPLFFFSSYGAHRDLHSFPTRRSSDLEPDLERGDAGALALACLEPGDVLLPAVAGLQARSEEHTSELQSHSDLVCRLLLEKKNNLGPLPHWLLLNDPIHILCLLYQHHF